MERYQHITRFSLLGHVHSSGFFITKGIMDNKNIGLSYMSAAVTTFGGNPVFTVVDIDEEFMIPLNFHIYYMNVTEANLVD